MRIAVLVIGLPLALLIFLQGCTVGALESASGKNQQDKIGGWGVIIGFAYLVGSALVMASPMASTIVFALSAVAAFAVAAGTQYNDMWVWGTLAVALGVMSFFARRTKQQKAIAPTVPVSAPSPAMQTVVCPRCNSDVPANVRFCPNCGLSRTPETP